MDYVVVQIVLRYIHIVSAVLAVGGLAFMSLCLSPAVRLLDDGFSESWMKMIRLRFGRLLWASIGGLVVSGVYNWVLFAETYRAMGGVGGALIGTKVLLALVMFAVVWAGAIGLMKPKASQMAAVHLAALVILLAAVLRYFRLEHVQSIAGGG